MKKLLLVALLFTLNSYAKISWDSKNKQWSTTQKGVDINAYNRYVHACFGVIFGIEYAFGGAGQLVNNKFSPFVINAIQSLLLGSPEDMTTKSSLLADLTDPSFNFYQLMADKMKK